MFKRILVPTDGSERAKHAAERALKLAAELNSEIHFLYVVDSSVMAGLPDDAWWEQLSDALREEGESVVGALEDQATEAGVEAKGVVVEGSPGRDIVSYAKENGVDLVIMSTAGRKGLDKFLMGSTTDRVLRSATCPVMVIRESEVKE